MYTIEIKSDFAELYRYNIIATCAGYDIEQNQLYVSSAEMVYSEEINTDISATPIKPEGFVTGRPLILECAKAESIHLILYVITNTLPEDRMVENTPPFALQVSILRHSDELIYNESHEVNQWGGATINIKL